MPVYLYWGEEEFNLENAVSDLKDKILDPSWAALNHKILNEPDITLLIESLETMPMVFGNLLVEIKSSSLFLRGAKKQPISDNQMKRLLNVLENLNERAHVLFVCKIPRDSGKKVDSVIKLTKTISKVGKVVEFPAFKSYQEDKIIDWINQKSKTKDIKVSSDAAKTLIQNIGTDLRRLDSELDKLKLNAYPDKNITVKHLAVSYSDNDNVFLLADHWLKKDKASAVIELTKLFEKNHPLKIIATLQTVIKKWIKIKVESRTRGASEIARMINLHEFVVKKEIIKLNPVHINDLIKFKNLLTEMEFKIKSGEIDANIALEIAVIS